MTAAIGSLASGNAMPNEKAAGNMPSGPPGSKFHSIRNAYSAPVFKDYSK
jgi:hypothetical protein